MESKKINQLATNVAPVSTDLTIIGDPITGVSKKITLLQLASIFSGLIGFFTNYAAFPATGTINIIYCAKDTQKLYLWNGSAYVEIFPNQALLDTYQLRSEKGVSNGYASLDSGGKVPISQLPSSIMEYKGMWNASTNTPTLANGTGDTGDVYICNVAGSVNFGAGVIVFAVGDYVIYSGTIWQRSSGAVGTVTSVGLSTNGNSITIGSSPISTSGTITANFAGTSLQYINGAGNLTTFPTLLSSDNLVALVRNQSGATMTAGTIVYISGATGNKPLITKALATGDSTSAQTYGFVQSNITNNADGYVVVIGNVSDLNTSALTEGQQLYLSGTTAGTYTTTKPYAPIHLVYVGIVLRAHPTQGIIGVKIQNGFEMDELHNVDAYLPNNNDILSYNTTTSLWEHKQIATTLGYTPANDSLVVHLAGTETITGDKVFNNVINFNTYQTRFGGGVALNNTTSGGSVSSHTIIGGNVSGLQVNLAAGGYNNLNFASTTVGNTYTFPNATGTIALVGGSGVGTVTSVAALTLGTTGTDLSSTVATGTTTPVITLNVPTSSATNRGALSSADWSTFNGKQAALNGTGFVKASGTTISYDNTSYLPLTGGTLTGNLAIQKTSGIATINFLIPSGGNDPAFIQHEESSIDTGIMRFSVSDNDGVNDYFVFGNTSGTAGAFIERFKITSSGIITLATWNGTAITDTYISSAATWNAKQNALTNPVTGTGTTNYHVKFTGTSTIGNSLIYDNGTNVGINTITPKTYSSLTNNGQLISLQNIAIDYGQSYRFNNYYNSGTVTDRTISTGYAAGINLDAGNMTFSLSANSVAADTNVTLAERMRITSGGNVCIGTTSAISSSALTTVQATPSALTGYFRSTATSSPFGIIIEYTGSSPNNTSNEFINCGDSSAARFKVTSNGNCYNVNGTYTSGVSDIRYKEQVVDANSQWDDIKNLRVVNFKFINDVEENGDNALRHIGFIAQEVEKTSPHLIEEMSDEKTGETWKTIKASIIHTKAIKALQEAMSRIEELEARLDKAKL